MTKKILSVLLVVVVLFSMMSITPSAVSSTSEYYNSTYSLTYEINNGEITIVGGGSQYTYIPAEIDGYPVTTIGERAFSRSEMEYVYISDSVKTICDYAFNTCFYLKTITIPASVKYIGAAVFYGCYSLTSIIVDENNKYYCNDENGILFNKDKTELVSYLDGLENEEYVVPDGVTRIGNGAFYDCDELKSIQLPDTLKEIGANAFYSINYLEKIELPDGLITIDDFAFFDAGWFCSGITNLNIPETVTYIGEYAFSGTSIINFKIPESVTFMGENAFYDCRNLECITVDNNNKYYTSDDNGVLFNKDKTQLIKYPPANSDISYTVPDTVTKICDNAFYGCSYLENIVLADSVLYIGSEAFYKSAYYNNEENWENGILYINNHLIDAQISITECAIKDGTLTIADEAFMSCSNLASVNLPDSLVSIGSESFRSCTSLIAITITENVQYIGSMPFYLCRNIEAINVDVENKYFTSDELGILYNKNKTMLIAFPSNNGITEYEVPDHISEICSGAFSGNVCLKTVTISGNVDTIGVESFPWTLIETMNVCDGITCIPEDFAVMSQYLKVVILPISVVAVDNYAFHFSDISDVYFSGSESDWNAICFGIGNYALRNATIHFNSTGPCEHTNTSLVNVKSATCTENGYTGDTVCDKCGETLSTGTAVPPLNHDMGAWTVTTPATCESVGEERSDCSRCDYYETREIAIKEHEDTDNDGHCDDCTENICEHTNTSLVNAKSATCTENGYTGDTVCDKCGETLTTGTATSPLNHDMGAWTVTTPATCESVGEEQRDCSRCDYYETREIAIKEHEDNDNDGHCDDCTENICEHTNTSLANVKSATCTENGYTGDTVCDKCGETLSTGTAIPPLNHDMGAWTVTTPATCESVGEERSDCSRCDYYETREIAIKEHEDTDNDGHCDDCKDNISDSSEDVPSSGDDTNKNESTNNNVHICFCACHSDNPFISFIYKIIRFLRMLFGLNYCRYCDCPYV